MKELQFNYSSNNKKYLEDKICRSNENLVSE